jgi:AbiV family abortive infection protein
MLQRIATMNQIPVRFPGYLTAVRRNINRLLDDAKLLHDAGRYASASALAAHAIEEVAKEWDILQFEGQPEPKNQKHKHRHRIISGIIIKFCLLIGASDILKRPLSELWIEVDDRVEDFDLAVLLMQVDQDTLLERPIEQAERYVQLTKQMLANETVNFGRRIFAMARDGELMAHRNRGLYVDVINNMLVDPQDVTAAVSLSLIEDCNRILKIMSMILEAARDAELIEQRRH